MTSDSAIDVSQTEPAPKSDGKMQRVRRYGIALASVIAAWLLRLAVDPYLHDFQPFSTFYVAVAFIAWRYGWRTAIVVQLLGYLAGDWFFSPPRGSLAVVDLMQAIELLMYFGVTTTIIFLIRSLRKANQAAKHALMLAKQKESELEADIVERKRLEKALCRRGSELDRLVQERTARLKETIAELEAFSYSITHDMRAPLRAMQSFASMIEAECCGCPRSTSQDLFRRIKTASHRLDQLITDSLDYSKLVREEIILKPVNVANLLRGIVETYPNLQPPGVDIELNLTDITVIGNEAALTQCFSNLLGNAIKFVARDVKPRVRVWGHELRPIDGASPSRVRIWIEDNGIGIPKEAHEKIFGMFQRMHRQEEYPGTGIGLTLVRKAVERMGGRVGLESEPGRGSRFWIELLKENR